MSPDAAGRRARPRHRTMIIGVGNPYRSDDGAGHAVISELQNNAIADTELVALSGEATQLIDTWSSAEQVILIDASSSSLPAGSVRRFNALSGDLPATVDGSSSHGFGVAEAVPLARNLGMLPAELIVYTIEGEIFDNGSTLSPRVAAATQRLAADLANALFSATSGSGRPYPAPPGRPLNNEI